MICDALLQYEREEGSYREFETAYHKVMQRRKQMKIAEEKKEERIAKENKKMEKNNLNRKQRRQQERGEPVVEKKNDRKRGAARDSQPSKNAEPPKKQQRQQQLTTPDAPMDVDDQATKKKSEFKAPETPVPKPSGHEIDPSTAKERTVFVSNLDYSISPDRLLYCAINSSWADYFRIRFGWSHD